MLQGGGSLCETQNTKRRRSDGRSCQHIPARVTRWIAGADGRETEAGGKGKGGVEGKTAGMDGICEWNNGPGIVGIGHDLVKGSGHAKPPD